MSVRTRNPWIRLGWGAWSMGLEASTVIGLRTMRIAAGGPGGKAEVRRMVTEKVDAALEIQRIAMMGGLGATPAAAAHRTLRHYRRKVRANRRRLA